MSFVIDPYRFGVPFSPADVGWHTAFWASDPSWTPPANGGNVTSWRDYSGNGRAATNPGTAPVYRTSGINSKPAVEFTGGARTLVTSTFTTVSQPSSLVLVLDPTLASISQTTARWADNYQNGSARQIFGGWSTTAHILGAGTNVLNAGPTPTVNRQLVVGVFNGSSSFVWSNNSQGSNVNPGTGGIDGIRIGGDGSSSNFTGYIAFFALYEGNVTASDKWAAFTAWANDFYGLGY